MVIYMNIFNDMWGKVVDFLTLPFYLLDGLIIEAERACNCAEST